MQYIGRHREEKRKEQKYTCDMEELDENANEKGQEANNPQALRKDRNNRVNS